MRVPLGAGPAQEAEHMRIGRGSPKPVVGRTGVKNWAATGDPAATPTVLHRRAADEALGHTIPLPTRAVRRTREGPEEAP